MSTVPHIVKPLEFGIVVSDLAASKLFYRDLLGLVPEREMTIAADTGMRTGVASAGFTISRFTADCGSVVKLLQPEGAVPDAASNATEICSRATTSFLTLVVQDLELLMQKLRKAGVKVNTTPAIVDVRAGMRLAFVADPDGFPLELVEYE